MTRRRGAYRKLVHSKRQVALDGSRYEFSTADSGLARALSSQSVSRFNDWVLAGRDPLMLWVARRRRDPLAGYRYPQWLLVIGVIAWSITLYLGYSSITSLGKLA